MHVQESLEFFRCLKRNQVDSGVFRRQAYDQRKTFSKIMCVPKSFLELFFPWNVSAMLNNPQRDIQKRGFVESEVWFRIFIIPCTLEYTDYSIEWRNDSKQFFKCFKSTSLWLDSTKLNHLIYPSCFLGMCSQFGYLLFWEISFLGTAKGVVLLVRQGT